MVYSWNDNVADNMTGGLNGGVIIRFNENEKQSIIPIIDPHKDFKLE